MLREGITRTLFVALFRVLRLSAPKADLNGGARLGWASAYGTLVLAMDRMLLPLLAPLRSKGMMASRAS